MGLEGRGATMPHEHLAHKKERRSSPCLPPHKPLLCGCVAFVTHIATRARDRFVGRRKTTLLKRIL